MTFLDTNVLVYAADDTDVAKHGRARIKVRYGLQYYDSLLLATAEANGCEEFCSEDLNDGQTYCGIKAVNPFKVAQK